jgi:hypothetical protein
MPTIARPCNDDDWREPDPEPPCFPVLSDDSSEASQPGRDQSPVALPIPPSVAKTAGDRLADAIKRAVDEGDLDLAGALLDVARKSKPAPVTSLEVVRARRDVDGSKT